jgi:L-seryl-tRNA(Ser) seleniumtransferase
LKRAPLFRALRCDKLILSALEATVDRYLAGGIGSGREACAIPVVDMMKTSERELRARAEAIGAALSGSPGQARVGTGEAQIGGGTLPKSVLPSVTVDLVHRALAPQQLAARLREHSTPVIGYVSRGTVKLDLRTVFAHQDQEVVAAIRAACSR